MVLAILLVCAVLSMIIGATKGRSGAGLLLGLFLGPIGLIIIAVLPPNETALVRDGALKLCPYCAEAVKLSASVCKHCGKELFSEK